MLGFDHLSDEDCVGLHYVDLEYEQCSELCGS